MRHLNDEGQKRSILAELEAALADIYQSQQALAELQAGIMERVAQLRERLRSYQEGDSNADAR